MPELDAASDQDPALATRTEGRTLILRLTGELDLTSTDRILSDIDAVLDGEHDDIAFDLSGLNFMDSSGIALLLSVSRRVGGNLELRDPTPIIRRLIELTGLESVLRLVP
ncbi:MAG TPA: STAS domain-containing protein [Streptosporangiaceae bacterium]|nr:STAS domain-containing protein [Streptosporangiaceae bacterium]